MSDRAALRKLCDEATRKPTIRGVYTLDTLEYARITAAARKAIPDLLDTLEAVEAACKGAGEPIGYDPTYALAQRILTILEGGER